jgi:hypothetical protein
MFPRGRGRLATNPEPTGSATTANTIGIVTSAILSYFGIVLGGWVGYLISGFIGAVLLIWIVRADGQLQVEAAAWARNFCLAAPRQRQLSRRTTRRL